MVVDYLSPCLFSRLLTTALASIFVSPWGRQRDLYPSFLLSPCPRLWSSRVVPFVSQWHSLCSCHKLWGDIIGGIQHCSLHYSMNETHRTCSVYSCALTPLRSTPPSLGGSSLFPSSCTWNLFGSLLSK